MLKVLSLAAICATVSFGGVLDYASEAAWLDATAPTATSYFTETFQNNQINTAGLSLSTCSWGCLVPGGFDEITNDQLYLADGKHAYQPLTGAWGSYVTSTFALPANINGIGFTMTAPASTSESPLGIVLTLSDGSINYWQYGPMAEDQSPAFSGFQGFYDSSADIISASFIGGSADITQIIGSDPTAASTATPEPSTWGLMGGALVAIGFVKYRKLSGQ
jgi:hypothetical protein